MRRRSGAAFDVDRSRRRFDAVTGQLPGPVKGSRIEKVSVKGVRGEWVTAKAVGEDRTVYYIHGGGYFWGSPAPYRNLTSRLSRTVRAPVFALDYRLAPEHVYPAALEDAVAGYDWLLERGYDAADIALGGDSAGGGLVLATLLWLRDHGRPLPAAAFAISPLTDLAVTGNSVRSNADADPMFAPEDVRQPARLYPGAEDPAQPYISPLYGDPSGLPPTLIQVGSTELLLDDATRMAEKMSEANVPVELAVWPNMPHVWHMLAFVVPEGRKGIVEIGNFVRRHWDGGKATVRAAE